MPTFLRRFCERISDWWQMRSSSVDLLLWGLRGIFGAIVIGVAIVALNFVEERHFSGAFYSWATFFVILCAALALPSC